MFREGLRPPNPFSEDDPLDAEIQDGVSLRALSRLGPLLLVLLGDDEKRWLAAVAAQRDALERGGTRIALAHLREAAWERHGLTYVARVADPEGKLHEALGLGKASRLLGAPRQLPGAFLVVDCEVKGEFRPRALGETLDLASVGG